MSTTNKQIRIRRFDPYERLKGKTVFIKGRVVSENLSDGSLVVKLPDYQEETQAGNLRFDYGDTFVLTRGGK